MPHGGQIKSLWEHNYGRQGLELRWNPWCRFGSLTSMVIIIIIKGNLWCPISWEPRALTKADKLIHFKMHTRHTHTCTHTNIPHTHTHAPTHTCKNTSIVVMGLMETEESDQSVGRREEVGVQFWHQHSCLSLSAARQGPWVRNVIKPILGSISVSHLHLFTAYNMAALVIIWF